MNKKLKLILIIAAAVILLTAVVIAAVLLRSGDAPVETSPPPTPTDTPEPVEPTEPADEIVVKARVALAGDVVMHSGLLAEGQRTDGSFDFAPVFGIVKNYIANADYAACSLVASLGQSNYTAYPRFRSPAALANSLSEVGFNLINTATSHAVDGFKDGVDYTLDCLDSVGLAHVGTYRNEEERAYPVTFVDLNGIRVAFLSYTFDTNQIPVAGFEYAVNICTTDYLSGGTEINFDLIDADLKAAHDGGADAVFVFMSWGKEFETEPNEQQTVLAEHLFTQGADVIIGGHTRVPQPMERHEITDIYGETRTRFVCYSLGNLISCQNDEYTDISAVIDLELSKEQGSGRTWISDLSYAPIYMADLYDLGITDFDWHYRLVDLHTAIAAYESGEDWDFMTDKMYTDMVNSLADLHTFFGEELDYANKAQ